MRLNGLLVGLQISVVFGGDGLRPKMFDAAAVADDADDADADAAVVVDVVVGHCSVVGDSS